MKKLVFVLIALFCFFLIACNEKQVNEKLDGKSVDNKINLESKQDLDNNLEQEEIIYDEQLNVETSDIEETNHEQKVNVAEKTQVDEMEKNDEQNDNINSPIQFEVNLEELGDKIIDIRNDCLNYLMSKGEDNLTIDDIQIVELYGIFGDSVVFKVQRGAWEVFSSLTLGEYTFVFTNSNTPLVWNNGIIFELKDAYDANLFTDQDIINLDNVFKRSIN